MQEHTVLLLGVGDSGDPLAAASQGGDDVTFSRSQLEQAFALEGDWLTQEATRWPPRVKLATT